MAEREVTGGISTVGLLLIAFVVLKLTHVIHWSWWWVLSPLWIQMLLFVLIFVIAVLAAGGSKKWGR